MGVISNPGLKTKGLNENKFKPAGLGHFFGARVGSGQPTLSLENLP